MRSLVLAWLLVACMTLPVSAQGRRIAWEQPAPAGVTVFNSTQAAGYVYRYYIQGVPLTGVVVAGVTCVTTNDALVKTCSAPLPAEILPGMAFALTATSLSDVESAQSNVVLLTAPIVPAVPMRLRLLGKLVTPWAVLGSKVRRLM